MLVFKALSAVGYLALKIAFAGELIKLRLRPWEPGVIHYENSEAARQVSQSFGTALPYLSMRFS